MNARFVISQVKADLGIRVGVREVSDGQLEHTAITANPLYRDKWIAVVESKLYAGNRLVSQHHKTLVYDQHGPVN